ncbi:MAG: putative uridylyltransferase [Phycisphaerae bacterium]|nr:putative uridylyltransferase [Phycisphaerae bacterium]
MDHASAQSLLQTHGQLHLLKYWADLSAPQQEELLADIQQTDWVVIADQARKSPTGESPLNAARFSEPPVCTCSTENEPASLYAEELKIGEDLLRAGKVAALTVAGGQGTRLGFSGPKGTFPISPVKNKTLFALFAEYLAAINYRYGCSLRWYIMTSPENHHDTRTFFEQHHYFGLQRERVCFFQQGTLPALDMHGRVLMAERHRLAMSPDGHGGTLRALRAAGGLEQLHQENVEYLSYFQIDNPMLQLIDPIFIGLVARRQSEFGSKVMRKAHDFERVGVFVKNNDHITVIEYSDLPAHLATERKSTGERLFDFANVAAHVFTVSFAQRLSEHADPSGLPWHRAVKKIPYWDIEQNRKVFPPQPNAIKLEQFIFDAIPLAKNPLLFEIRREEEFAPVKNAEGIDSPATAKAFMIGKWRRWLAQAGKTLPEIQRVEISPIFALDPQELQRKLDHQEIDLTKPIYLGP